MLILIGILLFCVCYPVLYVICGAAEYWHLVLGIFLCGTGFIGLFTENKDGTAARLLSFLLFMSLLLDGHAIHGRKRRYTWA